MVCLIMVSAFPSITFLRVSPGFIAKSFRGVGVGFEEPSPGFIAKPLRGVGMGFEEPHLRLMF